MTLIEIVVSLVQARGRASADDILPKCKGYTRAQVVKAMQNASAQRLIHKVGVGPRVGRGQLSIFALGDGGEPEAKAHKAKPREPIPDARGELARYARVSSVWELGDSSRRAT